MSKLRLLKLFSALFLFGLSVAVTVFDALFGLRLTPIGFLAWLDGYYAVTILGVFVQFPGIIYLAVIVTALTLAVNAYKEKK